VGYVDCGYSHEIAIKADALMKLKLRQKDASHIACAVAAGADYFLTTDKKILNKPIEDITVINPIDFIRRYEDDK
jgi:predicted nucleic acid-binding protein